MALLELTLVQSYQNQTCINRWTYQATGTPAAVSLSFALVKAFGGIPTVPGVIDAGTPLAAIQAMQNAAVEYSLIRAQDIYPNPDFYETPLTGITGTGGDAGSAAPSYVSYGFRSTIVNRAIGRTYKRFVGVTETVVGGAGVISQPFLDNEMAAVATAMQTVLNYDDEGNTITLTPTVIQKERTTIPDTNPPRYRYNYYPTLQQQLDHIAQGFQFQPYPNTRSQVSRQVGRGI